MININIYSKNGDNGYYDYDGCDKLYGEIKMDCLPVIGQILEIKTDEFKMKCIVKEVATIVNDYKCWHNVYVLVIK